MSTKISALNPAIAGNVTDATVLPLVDATTTTVKVTIAQLRTQITSAACTFASTVTVNGNSLLFAVGAGNAPQLLHVGNYLNVVGGSTGTRILNNAAATATVTFADSGATSFGTGGVTIQGGGFSVISGGLYALGGDTVMAGAALATGATSGYHYIPTCAGAPTGIPTTYTGVKALHYDTTNNKIWVYNGAWRGVVVA